MAETPPTQQEEQQTPDSRLAQASLLVLGLAAGALAPSLTHLSLLLALALCVTAPALPRLRNVAALLLAPGLLAALRFDPSPALLTTAYLALCGGVLLGLRSWSERGGQALATAVGCLALALPYLAGALPLESQTALSLVLHSPLPILSGTCAGEDLLRQGSLYRLLPAAQSVPYAYPSPLVALGSALALAALAWLPRGVTLLRQARLEAPRVPAPALALLALALLLGAPQDARAQGLFPAPSADPSAGGDLKTRVRLGYYIPILEGFVRLDPARAISEGRRGDRVDYLKQLDLSQNFLVPTFEIELAWENTGGLRVQYVEALWRGETQNNDVIIRLEEQRINVGNILDTRYRFRTIALGGYIDLPLADFLTARLLTTFRYVKNEIKIRASPQGLSIHNSQEAIIPTLGGGLDVSIWNVIYAYGDIQWLDFRTSTLGAEKGRWRFRYREWRAGIRLELVEHAHMMLEWYSLFLDIRDHNREQYRTDLMGLRFMVAVQF
ncbi:MAG: hypothetical protein JKY65_07835 [Planctomycetes bacterium]|nr:hypothetical protein [Planctomycetota bacterium]